MTALEKVSSYVNRLVEYVLFGMGFIMAIVVAAQVFSRYALNHSIFWSEELARFLLVWLTFLGASVVYRRGGHASIEILYDLFPLSIQKITSIIIHLVALAFFVVMIIYGWRFAYFVRLQISPALSLPKWIPHGIIPLSGAILALHALNFFFNALRKS